MGRRWSRDESEATAEQVLLAQHGVSEGAVPQGCDSRAGWRHVEEAGQHVFSLLF